MNSFNAFSRTASFLLKMQSASKERSEMESKSKQVWVPKTKMKTGNK